MLALLRTRPHFRRLWVAGAISLVGDWLSFVAISLLTMRQEKSAIALGVMYTLMLFPRAVMVPFAGVLADRIDRRRILIGASILQATLTAAMVAAAATASIGAVFVLVLLRAAAGALAPPAEAAAIPRVVEQEEIAPANALLSSMWSMSFIVGMALGGVLAQLGPTVAIALDGLTFVASAILVARLPPLVPSGAEAKAKAKAAGTHALARIAGDVREAWRYAAGRPEVLRALFAKSLFALATTTAWVVLNLVADSGLLGPAGVALGTMQAIRGIGTGVGPVVFLRIGKRGIPLPRLLDVTFVIGLGAVLVFAVTRVPVALYFLVFVWGFGSGANWVVSSTIIQKGAEDAVLGRVSSLDDMALTLMQSASAIGGAAMVDRLGGAVAVTIVTVASAVAWTSLTLFSATRARAAERAAMGGA